MSATEQGLNGCAVVGPEDFVARGLRAQAEVDALTAPTQHTRPASLNPTRFLNRAEVRNFLLMYAEENRAHKFSRVSEETLVQINEAVRTACIGVVRRAPSKGKTL